MDMKNFATMLLKDIEKSGLPIAEIKRILSNKGLSVSLVMGGLFCGLGIMEILLQSLPVFLLSLIP